MNALIVLAKKLSCLFHRNRFRSELDEEMAFHREQAERELISAGASPEKAHTAVARQFGNATQLREQSQSVIAFRWETFVQDLRFALRQLRQRPGFALMAIFILALGMGVSIAMFGYVDAVLIRPLPYAEPNRLLFVTESGALIPRANLSRDDYDDWKRMSTTLSSLEVYTSSGLLMRTGSVTEPVPAIRVSDGFLRTLGVKPILGRDFLPGEDQPGTAKSVILPWSTWQKRFGGRADIIGSSVSLDGNEYTIVGVLPREFTFAPRMNAEFWVPLLNRTECESRRSCHNLLGIARLRDGVTIGQATADLKRIAAELERQYPGSNRDQGAFVAPLREIVVGDVRPILLTLLSGSGLLLLIACINVASLLLVRSESRRREIAIRGALGATLARVLRQFVTEGCLLGLASGAAGVSIAEGFTALIVRLVPKPMLETMPYFNGTGMNLHTVLFALAVTLAASLILAVTPMVLLAQLKVQDALTDGGRTVAGRFWNRLGANLVVVELTVAVVLLAAAGLLGRSFYNLLHVPMGFDPDHLAVVSVIAPNSNYVKNEQYVALYREVQRRITGLPGVVSVGFTSVGPVQCNCNTDWIRIVGKPFHGEHNEVNERDVSPEYLQTLKARLVRGRMFNENDTRDRPNVIVINEALARKYFPGEDPIGKKVGGGDLNPKSLREIVGVVADLHDGGLDEEIWPAEYEPIYQSTDNYFAVVVRTTQDPKGTLPSVVNTIRSVDPNLGVFDENVLNDQINSSRAAFFHRFSAWIVAGFAGVALLLGVVGLYGVIAYSVSQRSREIGVRMALGAQRSTVYGMVMRQAGWLTLIGVCAGIVCAVAASTLIQKLLFGVRAWDLATLGGVAIVLGGASLVASFVPARRAASVNPMDALRSV